MWLQVWIYNIHTHWTTFLTWKTLESLVFTMSVKNVKVFRPPMLRMSWKMTILIKNQINISCDLKSRWTREFYCLHPDCTDSHPEWQPAYALRNSGIENRLSQLGFQPLRAWCLTPGNYVVLILFLLLSNFLSPFHSLFDNEPASWRFLQQYVLNSHSVEGVYTDYHTSVRISALLYELSNICSGMMSTRLIQGKVKTCEDQKNKKM